MSERVFLLGAGRVGRGLALAFRAAGLAVVGVHARTARNGATSAGALPPTLRDANVVLVAVSDRGLDEALTSVGDAQRAGKLEHGTVVLHTSGAMAPDALGALRALGVPCGTFHPLAPFATAEGGAAGMHGGWIGIDGDATACAAARRLAAAVGARTVNIPPGAKPAYHAAAVIASNFPVVLAAIATGVLTRAGIEPHAASQVTRALMERAIRNLELGAPGEVLTGPAARGDSAAITAHVAALADDAVAREVYEVLTHAARGLRQP